MRAVLYIRVSSDDQTQERRALLETISSTARKRAKVQEMAAEHITFSELEEKLRGLEQNAHDFLGHYSSLVEGAVETATSEKRRRVYKALGVRVRALPSGEAEVDLPILEDENGEDSVRMGDQCS